MKTTVLTLSMFFAILLTNCAYQVPLFTMPATNFYSLYDEKIPGTWIVVIDGDIKDSSTTVRTTSSGCSAHNYPVTLGEAVEASINETMQFLFEFVQYAPVVPDENTFSKTKASGVIVLKLENLSPHLTCSNGSCTGTTESAMGVIITDGKDKLFATLSNVSASAQGSSGGFCEGGKFVLSQSISKSIKKNLEQLGEKMSSCPKLRIKSDTSG